MAEKRVNSRIIHKHAVEADWIKATGFIPLQGEIIVYDIDSTHTYERIKIGDGVTNVNSLPFSTDAIVESINAQISGLQASISNVSDLVGDTSVSDQISAVTDGCITGLSVSGKVITYTKGDGTTGTITTQDTNTTYSVATTSANGLMSSTDKSKLDGVASGAEVNQNAFSNIVVGTTTVAADSKTDTLTIVAGNNITITPDATNDKITISAADVAIMTNDEIDAICI